MRNLATVTLYAIAAADPIEYCAQTMKSEANPVYTDYCIERCTFWSSPYGQAHCSDNVVTDGSALLQCILKMEGAACIGSAPTALPAPGTTEGQPILTEPTTATSSSTTSSSTTTDATRTTTTKQTTPSSTTTTTTTTATTTTASATTTTASETTTLPNPPTEGETSSTAHESTVEQSPPTEHKQGAPGFWSPDDAPEEKTDGPTGPFNECIWGWSSGSNGFAQGSYAGVGNKVYKAKQWAEPTDVPGVSAVWEHVTDCVGSAPETWTEAKMAALVEDPSKPTVFYDAWMPSYPSKKEIASVEESYDSDPQVKILRDAVRVLSKAEVEKISPGRAENPENVRRVESFISAETWEQLFPFRNSAYSYENYLKAIGAFPDYCKTYTDGRNSDAICKKLVAASFAHYTQETGAHAPAWTLNMNDCKPENTHEEAKKYFDPDTPIPTYLQGLYWLRETQFADPSSEDQKADVYGKCHPTEDQPWSIVFPCSEVTYYGRGSKQLSWNYNYGLFSKAMFNDPTVLLENPRDVADTWLNFASGIWFAVTPQSPKPPMTWALDGTWKKNDIDQAAGLAPGFGATIEIINGGYECRSASTTPQAANRIDAYKNFMKLFKLEIPTDEPNDCAGSKGFPTNSPVSTLLYWNKDWSKPGSCVLNTIQSPFLVVNKGDYGKCVDFYWRSHIMYEGKEIIRNGDTIY